jgi:hypothetical protein
MKYRIKLPFIGVHRRGDGKSQFVTMEPGNVFTIRGEQSGMVNVMYERRIVAVFRKDIEEHTEKIRGAGA